MKYFVDFLIAISTYIKSKRFCVMTKLIFQRRIFGKELSVSTEAFESVKLELCLWFPSEGSFPVISLGEEELERGALY